MRLYCWPHAGGAASAFLNWRESQACPGLSIVPVEPPGRGHRRDEPPAGSMEELVSGFLDALSRRPRNEPFALFGHSLGALVAYEAARHALRSGTHRPLCLIVAAARPPAAAIDSAFDDLSDGALVALMARLGGTLPNLLDHEEIVRRSLPVLRADLSLMTAYRRSAPSTVLPLPILALSGRSDAVADPAGCEGWRSMTSDRFQQRSYLGSHFFPHERRDEILAAVAATIEDCLASPAAPST